MTKWYEVKGENNDVCLYSKISLSRNINETVFPSKLTYTQKSDILKKVLRAIETFDEGKFQSFDLNKANSEDLLSLIEKGLIEKSFLNDIEGKGIIESESEDISLLTCDNDHIRLSIFSSGLSLSSAFEKTDRIDTEMDKILEFAFDEKLGYLTQSPVNLGTAMHASLVMFLPALSSRRHVQKLAATLSGLGLVFRDLYENRYLEPSGIYVLSNEVTLGISEEDALKNLSSIGIQIIEQERGCRENIVSEASFEDSFFRALGTLQNARILSYGELVECLCVIRIGNKKHGDTLNDLDFLRLLQETQPATLKCMKNDSSESFDENEVRAEVIRDIFKII